MIVADSESESEYDKSEDEDHVNANHKKRGLGVASATSGVAAQSDMEGEDIVSPLNQGKRQKTSEGHNDEADINDGDDEDDANALDGSVDESPSALVREHVFAHGGRLQVRQGDITEEHVDAIVNAANGALAHGGGVAGAISRRGGPSIQKESSQWVRAHGQVATGQVAVTSAGRLPARLYVIHAVGPVYIDGEHNEPQELYDAFFNSLLAAEKLGCASISIPAISSGIFGFPKDEVARIAFDAAFEFFDTKRTPPPRLKLLRFTNFDAPTVAVFASEFDQRQRKLKK
jgi:putative ATPase